MKKLRHRREPLAPEPPRPRPHRERFLPRIKRQRRHPPRPFAPRHDQRPLARARLHHRARPFAHDHPGKRHAIAEHKPRRNRRQRLHHVRREKARRQQLRQRRTERRHDRRQHEQLPAQPHPFPQRAYLQRRKIRLPHVPDHHRIEARQINRPPRKITHRQRRPGQRSLLRPDRSLAQRVIAKEPRVHHQREKGILRHDRADHVRLRPLLKRAIRQPHLRDLFKLHLARIDARLGIRPQGKFKAPIRIRREKNRTRENHRLLRNMPLRLHHQQPRPRRPGILDIHHQRRPMPVAKLPAEPQRCIAHARRGFRRAGQHRPTQAGSNHNGNREHAAFIESTRANASNPPEMSPPCTAGVSPASSRGVSPRVGTAGETPPELAGEDAGATPISARPLDGDPQRDVGPMLRRCCAPFYSPRRLRRAVERFVAR